MSREIHVHINKRFETWAKARMRAQSYLYSNFEMRPADNPAQRANAILVIKGEDQAGFTAEAQAERLRSGLFAVTVVS